MGVLKDRLDALECRVRDLETSGTAKGGLANPPDPDSTPRAAGAREAAPREGYCDTKWCIRRAGHEGHHEGPTGGRWSTGQPTPPPTLHPEAKVERWSRWHLLIKVTPSGKRLFVCLVCGRESVAPDKECLEPVRGVLSENRPCSWYERNHRPDAPPAAAGVDAKAVRDAALEEAAKTLEESGDKWAVLTHDCEFVRQAACDIRALKGKVAK